MQRDVRHGKPPKRNKLARSNICTAALRIVALPLMFSLPDFASSHWVHSLCLDFFVCHCLACGCMLYYGNMVR